MLCDSVPPSQDISSLYKSFQKIINKVQFAQRMHNAPGNSHILTPHLLSLMPAQKQKQPAKKNQKGQRTSNLQHPVSDLDPKNARKNQENIPKRANQAKPASQGKKVKKKVVPQRIIPTPQPQMQRRLKTEGPWQGEGGSLKKEKRAHVKSVSQGSKLPIGKKERTVMKSKARDKHAKSCEIYGAWKRLPDVDHSVSEAGPFKRKRTPSHFACNDKVVSRLLNVSLLASEIGASPLVTSDRRSSQPSHSKTFKECLNSIDLRILRNLHDDVPAFAVREAGPDAVRAVMLRNQISLQQLTKRVTLIQRCWRKRQRNSVINTYKRLFQRATDNFFRQDKIADVSAIDIDIDRSESFELDSSHNQNLANLQQSQKSLGSMVGSQEGEDYRHRWIQESEENGEGLNIGKYRQLVQQEIRNLNKQVGVQKQGRGGLDSKYLLEELMRHNFSKKWIEEESSSLSDRQNINNPNPSVDQLTPSTFPKLSRNEEDEPSLDDSQVYDRNKYEMASLEESEVVAAKVEEVVEKKRETIDIQWINSQLHDQIIVKNYLDCGLEKFTLHAQKNQDRQGSSDEAIGERFQRANLAILRRRQQRKAVAELPASLGVEQAEEVVSLFVNGLLDEFAVGTPISNQDISAILKKCNAALPQRKTQPPPPRPIGIQTGFESILAYVDKLVLFAKDREDIVARITDNINKDIGPSSLEILSYLRPESEDAPPAEQSQDMYDEQGLFVVPAELFEEFQSQLEGEFKQKEQKEMGPRVKAYLGFWNRCIFQSYNQCLDYERPFGVEGRPYDWLKQRKVFRPVTRNEVASKIQKARQRLLQGLGVVAGVLPENAGEPYDQQQLHMANQERLSRILAVELLESESVWINYNDEMAELLVELSRVIEERLFFEFSGGEVKRLLRSRRVLAEQCLGEQSVEFSLEDLQ